MRRRLSGLLIGALLLAGAPTASVAQDLPAAEARSEDPFRPLFPLIGRSWRGTGVGPDAVEDVARWDWAVGGHAVRVVHSVNGGVYGGETLIFPDRDSGQLIFHYFTSGGFHTTGAMRQTGPDVLEITEAVHGLDGLEQLRSTLTVGGDGTYRTRGLVEQDGQWVEFGGFDYRVDGSATPVGPMRAGEQAPVVRGALTLSRRIVADPGDPGDAAAYLAVTGGADRLMAATCVCAARVELHRIDRSGAQPNMVTDPAWEVPVEVRPGSDLHLMLIDFDPASAVDGRVTLTLLFEQAGVVDAAFDVAPDSRAAWARFD